MKNSIRNLIITAALVTGMFGIVNAQAEVSGEFSSDVTFGDAIAFSRLSIRKNPFKVHG